MGQGVKSQLILFSRRAWHLWGEVAAEAAGEIEDFCSELHSDSVNVKKEWLTSHASDWLPNVTFWPCRA